MLFITVPNAANIRKRINILFGKTNYPNYKSFYFSKVPYRGHVREYVKDDLIKLAHFLDLDIAYLGHADFMAFRKLNKYIFPIYALLTKFIPSFKDTVLLVARKRADWNPQ